MKRFVVLGSGVVGALTLLIVLANVVGAFEPSQPEGVTDGPVIALGADLETYPIAGVTGRLKLAEGCLLVGTAAVFWPAGTSWDDATRTVSFGGEFADAADVRVGDVFSGGGGSYDEDDLADNWESLDVDALRRCMRALDEDGAQFVYPG